MPAPDGRAWLTSAEIADQIVSALEQAGIVDAEHDGADARLVAEIAYRNTGYTQEFKILRLTEQLKDRIEDGTITDLQEVKTTFADIYNADVLALYDEEGNLIDEEDEE